ncbi:MAG: hypothetical protein PHO37_00435 [Kiritimatiellae bacterium]|nr:hypothetical protein [Kiritimatiellia bacterium]
MRLISSLPRNAMLAAACAVFICIASPGVAAPLPGYSLGSSTAPQIRITTNSAANAWLTSNNVAPLAATFAAAPDLTSTPISSLGTIAGRPRFTLPAMSDGFPIENTKPQYYLGDRLIAPAGVDWVATYEHWLASPAEQAVFLFDNIGARIFVIQGGTHPFTWVMDDGSEEQVTYNLASVVSGRPFRIYWTEPPYDAPPINLSGKFVKLYGPDSLVTVSRGAVTNLVGGFEQIITNNIVSGVFLDPSTKLLRAFGNLRGQLVLAYYDSGLYDTIKHVQVVEVGAPDVIDMKGGIGRALQPCGSGYNVTGLTAFPQAKQATDNRGDFYYQHQGEQSYSPKHGAVFPLRDTTDAAWRLPVYWMEEDRYGTLWPFELCHYACAWPADAQTLIVGAKVPIPSDYTVSLMSFQEPEGHAKAPSDNVFSTLASGHSLLRLLGDDNVWFIPIHAVDREDPNYFDLSRQIKWTIGAEIIPFPNFHICHVDGYAPDIDTDAPGYINLLASGGNYNPRLYKDPTASSDGIFAGDTTNNFSEAASGGDTNVYPSVIYPVNTADKPLEVWWSGMVQQAAMPTGIAFPCAIDRYRAEWPALDAIPQIVLASGAGSSAECVRRAGGAALFKSPEASLKISDRALFSEIGGGISFWTKNVFTNITDGALLSIGAFDGPRFFVDQTINRDTAVPTITYTASFRPADTNVAPVVISTPALPIDNAWHKIAFAYDSGSLFGGFSTNSNPAFHVFVDGAHASVIYLAHPLDSSGVSRGNSIGAAPLAGRFAPKGTLIDSVLFRNAAPSAASRLELFYENPTSDTAGATAYISFDEEAELSERLKRDTYTIVESVQGTLSDTKDIFISWPGAPRLESGELVSDTTPVVYGQRSTALPGYNPNEEHAFIQTSVGGYIVWALRCDLNTPDTSEPIVLVEYTRSGNKAMQAYSVVATNQFHPALAGTATVGTVLPGPHPLDMMDNPWLPQNTWDANGAISVFRDRKKQLWSRAPGLFDVYMYYANKETFDYPSLAENPDVGTPVPWLGYLEENAQPDANVLTRTPAPWRWTAAWPKHVETMRIGQTLTTAAGGLPEVWNAASLAVVYPDASTSNTLASTALLYDPTVAQHSGSDHYTTPATLFNAMGFTLGNTGDAILRAGKYRFQGLPPSVSDRFYINANLDAARCITLEGALVEKTGGASILYPNVLTASERAAIKNLVPADSPVKALWNEMIARLAVDPVLPSSTQWIGDVATGSDPSVPGTELVVDYIPRDHYALTAMGAADYVVLIENDAIDERLGVDSGDPISMHVFAITNDYYAGRVVAREDPRNLLSEQLSILYTEAFAGTADDYVFEWKNARPNANGTIPDDYANAYSQKFPLADSIGLTRFTIGEQGDTLANMVNTYYVCRYRAANTNSAAYPAMGYAWSDWCGPALAEGWVQRVLNNVTPFTQRMQDLYDNTPETMVTMLEQAGAPYDGDVALNQDNLTSIGLIQLYQTVLNKAEALSLTLGLSDSDANKQLQLAVGRLGDLYMVLGNEALSDALNPTIGFGTEYGGAAAGFHSVDYGEAFSAFFCFDNQVPSLLDEELALLRGRSGENAPSVRIAPYYNRLVWNFTKGIHAGEVAYAVNYNINSGNGDAVVDEEDAAAQFPQGHGDAYGHYLSALSGYYRLLRNPYFSWGAPSMGEMVVNDAVVNVDYYDEARFVEVADKLAETAALATDRTARKAWRDNGGLAGAGYVDEDPTRAFGYGEWATRGGVGAVMNWMVGNSLLPEGPQAATTHVLSLAPGAYAYMKETPLSSAHTPQWTIEAQFKDVVVAGLNPVPLLCWHAGTNLVTICVAQGGHAQLYVYALEERDYVAPEEEPGENPEPVTDKSTIVLTNTLYTAQLGALPSHALIALSREGTNAPSVRLFDIAAGALAATVEIDGAPQLDHLADGYPVLGGEISMRPSELRFWEKVRSDAELLNAAAIVSSRSDHLLAYSRCISEQISAGELVDDVSGGYAWYLEAPTWSSTTEGGLSVAFTDAGLLRIDRSTAKSLTSLPQRVGEIQSTLNRLDSGLNPLGLSQNAVPFDITPLGADDGSLTHFEQIAGRARRALANASTILDEVQTLSSRLRMIENASTSEEEVSEAEELAHMSQLIDIFGYPFADDIGPGGTYVQGYDGPDLLNFMWMDLSPYGIAPDFNLENTVLTYKIPSWLGRHLVMVRQVEEKTALSWSISANGLVMKPDSIRGTRRATGRIQQAYADFLSAYATLDMAIDWYGRKKEILDYELNYAAIRLHLGQYKKYIEGAKGVLALSKAKQLLAARLALVQVETALALTLSGHEDAVAVAPGIVGAGMTVNTDLKSVLSGALLPLKETTLTAMSSSQIALKSQILRKEDTRWQDAISGAMMSLGNYVELTTEIRDRYLVRLEDEWEAARNVGCAYADLVAAYDEVDALVAEGERVMEIQTALRARRVNRLTKLRYNDMFFRQLRSDVLQRYEAAFLLAQKYVYLAAQAYDYETAQLSADKPAGDLFRAEIVGSRSLGHLGPDGEPKLATGIGEAGLSDTLARMEANWLVLKPRLGINNPEHYATWFSLRRELFRITPDTRGDANWRTELAKYWVEDLRSLSEYRRYCQPFSSSAGLEKREPGFVIPFSTDINFGENFFGKTLQQGDSAYDSTYYSTKIAGAGVRFVGYNEKINGYTGSEVALGATPVVYLLPLGADRMRVPGGGEQATILDYNVVDQVVPVPYVIGATKLDDPDWQPFYDGYTGGADLAARIRRYPSFRAIIGPASDAGLSSSRLVGRSAWNTRWAIIIPAGAMQGGDAENRAVVRSLFLNGKDINRDGKMDISGVRDIELGLKTYSNSGN